MTVKERILCLDVKITSNERQMYDRFEAHGLRGLSRRGTRSGRVGAVTGG